MKKGRIIKGISIFWPAFLILAAVFLLWLSKQNVWIAEYIFARGFYKYYALCLSGVTQLLPFSLMELFIVLAPALVLTVLALYIWLLFKNRGKRLHIMAEFFGRLLKLGCIFFFWLVLTCSINYERLTFAEISQLTLRDSSVQELYDLCLYLTENANGLREKLERTDENGAMELANASVRELSKTAGKAYESLNSEYGVFDYRTAYSKPVFFSRAMSYTGLVGVYCPFTMETNINTDVAHYSIPSTICHELAHYYGFMREDEANFISYLACLASDSLEFQYSGTMLALIHAGNQLYAADAELYYKLWDSYNREVAVDLTENAKYWDAWKESKIQEVSNTVNDVYLKANNQSDGVKSYGRMVDLLLACYKK